MPVQRDKKTKRFYIEFQYKGFRYKERLPKGTTKATAEALEIKAKNDLLMQSHGVTRPDDITFERFLKEYFGPHIDRHYSKDTLHKAIYICKDALPFFKGKAMRSIKAADVEAFQAYRTKLKTQHKTERKPATVLRELSIISKIFSLAVDNDFCEYNPCSRVKKPSFDNRQDKILQYDDEDKFFTNMHSQWAKDICKFVLNTGLRQNDVMRLTKFEIDRTAKTFSVEQSKTKQRLVGPLNDEAMEIVERNWSNGVLLFPSPASGKTNGSVRHAIQRACARAEIPKLSIRDLRRTFVCRLQDNGTDLATIALLLGHTDTRSVHRYARSFEAMRKASDTLTQKRLTDVKTPVVRQMAGNE